MNRPPKFSSNQARLAYLDIVKGILVVLMVLYHSINYTSDYRISFRYLSFLPLSFIVITGFLLARVYAPRYQPGDTTLIGRLLLRGARLVAIFTALNLAAQIVRSPAHGSSGNLEMFFRHWDEVFLEGGSRTAAFDVLLPIAYVVLAAPILIALNHRWLWLIPAFTSIVIALCGWLEWRGTGIPNLNCVMVGLVGMFVGTLRFDPRELGRHVGLAVLAYGLYYPFGVYRGWNFLVQAIGACTAVAMLAAIASRMSERTWVAKRLVRLGQYSLLAYIVQIGILQILSRVVGRPSPVSAGSLLLLGVTLILMTMLIEITEGLRKRSSAADHVYRAVFA